jgi:translation elongation factor EF-G
MWRVLRGILNLGILAHVDAGKTTLTERLLYCAGVIDAPGSVDEGTTQTDSLALERQRGITIKSAVVSFTVGGTTVNLIDTPGHPDFVAEIRSQYSVPDGPPSTRGPLSGPQDFRKLTPLVAMAALKRAGTVVCEPVHRFRLETPTGTSRSGARCRPGREPTITRSTARKDERQTGG